MFNTTFKKKITLSKSSLTVFCSPLQVVNLLIYFEPKLGKVKKFRKKKRI